MPGELALQTAETLEGFKAQSIKPIVGTQSIDAIFGMASIIYKIISLLPLTILN